MIRRLLITALLCAWPLGIAIADDKPLHGVALVIGESKYEQLPQLTNPSKDARDIDRLFGDLGFDVDRVLNADGKELQEAIARFEDEAKDADVAVIYYSGHGIEAKGENFIAPTDTDISSPQAAGDSMIAVQPILEALAKVTPVSIVLLDACRSDPFPPGQVIVLPGDTTPTPVGQEGLAAVRGPVPVAAKPDTDPNSLGTVIGFSASPGEPALDGPVGENSPYAAALLKHFAAGGYSFGDVMTMVTEEVYLKTKARQLPWTNSSLRRVLTFDAPAEDESGDADQTAIKTERRKLLLSIAATPEQTQKYVESLAGQEQVPLDALYGMLDVLGVKPGSDGGDLQQQLQTGAARLKQLMAEKSPDVKTDPELERLSKLADDAQSEGAIALALKYRDQASQRADTLLTGKQAEADKLKQDMLDIAGTYADNAATALLNFDQLHAADLFAKAFDAVKDWDKAKAFDYKLAEGDALADQGVYNLDNDVENHAIAVYSEALALAPHDSDPVDWARLQDRIGQAQGIIGARLTDPAMLQTAAVSIRSSLTVLTKDGAPDRWAAVQNNLGNIFYELGLRGPDQAVLLQSIDAFDAALTVYTATANPERWATALSNRASAQIALADAIYAATDDIQTKALEAGNKDADNLPEVVAALKQSNAILTDVVTALEAALVARPRADSPFDWAQIANTRASAFDDRGKLSSQVADVQSAVSQYRDVLSVYDPTHMPAQWARAATNLATTLRHYARLAKDGAPLQEATDLLDKSLRLTPKAVSPVDWAELELKLGNVLADVVAYDNNKPEAADAAVAAYRASEEVTTAAADPIGWERLRLYEVQILLQVAVPTLDRPRLQLAHDLAVEARDTLKAAGSSDAGYFDQMLPTLEQLLGAMPK